MAAAHNKPSHGEQTCVKSSADQVQPRTESEAGGPGPGGQVSGQSTGGNLPVE